MKERTSLKNVFLTFSNNGRVKLKKLLKLLFFVKLLNSRINTFTLYGDFYLRGSKTSSIVSLARGNISVAIFCMINDFFRSSTSRSQESQCHLCVCECNVRNFLSFMSTPHIAHISLRSGQKKKE